MILLLGISDIRTEIINNMHELSIAKLSRQVGQKWAIFDPFRRAVCHRREKQAGTELYQVLSSLS